MAECNTAKEKFQESDEKLLAIFNSVRDGVAVLNKTGKIVFINKALSEIGGYSEKEILGKRIAVMKMFTAKSLAKMLAIFA